MDDIRPWRPGPLRNLKNLLVTAAILAVVLPGTVACNSGNPHAAHSMPARTSSPAPRSTTAHPHCELQVVKTGFSVQYGEGNAPKDKRDGNINYGIVVKNPCKNAALDSQLDVLAVSDAYSATEESPDHIIIGSPRRLPELLPGHTVNVCGGFDNGGDFDATKIAKIHVRVGTPQWKAGQPSQQVVRAEHVVLGSRNADGYVPITFQLRMTGELKYSWMAIITLNKSERIVSGENREIYDGGGSPGGTIHTSVWMPAGMHGLHSEISFVTDSYV